MSNCHLSSHHNRISLNDFPRPYPGLSLREGFPLLKQVGFLLGLFPFTSQLSWEADWMDIALDCTEPTGAGAHAFRLPEKPTKVHPSFYGTIAVNSLESSFSFLAVTFFSSCSFSFVLSRQ